MTDFKIKMAELAAKYHISHQRDIEWHNFVAEVQQLKEEQPVTDCDELGEAAIDIADALLAKPKGYALSAKADYWNGAHDGIIAGVEWQKAKMMEVSDKVDAMTEQDFRIIDDGIWISRSELEKMRRKYFGSALEAMDVNKYDPYRNGYFGGMNNLCLGLLIRIDGCRRPLTE